MSRPANRISLSLTMLLAALMLGGCAEQPRRNSSAAKPSPAATPAPAATAASSETTKEAANTPEQQFAEAVQLMKTGRLAEAETLLTALVTSHPERVAPRLNLGLLQSRRRQWAQAQQNLTVAAGLTGASNAQKAQAQNQLGIVLREQGQYPAAETAYQTALKLQPGHVEAQLNLAILYDAYLRQPALAIEHYQRYQQLLNSPEQSSLPERESMLTRTALWIERLKQAGAAE